MYSKTNRMISVAMSAALLLTNMIAPVKAFAQEVPEPMTDAFIDGSVDELPQEEPETEPPYYCVTLPYYENIVYMVDEGRVFLPEDLSPDDRDIFLRYQAEEKVEFAITTYNDVMVSQIKIRNYQDGERPFDLDAYGKVSFSMPSEDVRLFLEIEQPPAELPEEEELPEQQMDPILDMPGPDIGEEEKDPADPDIDDSVSEEAAPVEETLPQMDNGYIDYELDAVPDYEEPIPVIEEDPAVNEGENMPDIALTAPIEEDGLPEQGSITSVDAIEIPFGSEFDAASDFTNIEHDPDLDHAELISDEVNVNVPGTYSTIYRITHNFGEKMWFVLRPVIVLEIGQERESETAAPQEDDESAGSDDEEGDAGEEEENPEGVETVLETEIEETENISETEGLTGESGTESEELSENEEMQTEEVSAEEESENLPGELDLETVEEGSEVTAPENGYNVTEMDMPMIWRSEGEKPEYLGAIDENAVYTITVESRLAGADVQLDHEDGKYAAGSQVQATVTGDTSAGYVLTVLTSSGASFGTIDFGSEENLPVCFYMPYEDATIIVDALYPDADGNVVLGSGENVGVEASTEGDLLEEEATIPPQVMLLGAAVNASSLDLHTAKDIKYVNFISGEKAYFPNGYDAATMKTVVIYYKDGTNSGKRRAFCVDHYPALFLCPFIEE